MKRIVHVFLFTLLGFIQSYGQLNSAIELELDSFRTLLSNPATSELDRLKCNYRIALYWTYVHPDSGMNWSKMVEKQAENIGEDYFQYRALHFQTILHANAFRYDSALKKANQNLEFVVKKKIPTGIAEVHIDIGNIYLELGGLDSAKLFYHKAFEAASSDSSYVRITRCLINLGELEKLQSRYPQALDFLKEAEQISLGKNYTGFMATIYSNYGDIYFLQDELNQALNYYKLSVAAAKDRGNIARLGKSLYSLGKVYEQKRDLDSALLFAKQSAAELSNSNNKFDFAKAQIQLGRVFRLQNKNDSSHKRILAGIELLESQSVKKGLYEAYFESGMTYLSEKRYSRAEALFLKSIEMAKPFKEITIQIDAYNQLYLLAKKRSDKSAELNYLTRLRALEVELFDKDQIRQTAISQSAIEYEKIRGEDRAAAAKQLAEFEIENQLKIESEQMRRNVFIIITFLLLGLLFAGFRIYRTNQKKNNILSRQKDEISAQNDEREVLLKEIHHRVKNNLQIVSSLLELQTIQNDDEKSKEQLLIGQARVKSMALIHQELYQQENLAEVYLQSYLESLCGHIKAAFGGTTESELSIECGNFSLDVDRSVPLGLIINELVTNSYKYAFRNKTLKISIIISKIENNLEVLIRDNGPGIQDPQKIERPKTLGLRLVKRLSKQLKTKLLYEFGDGAVFKLVIEGE